MEKGNIILVIICCFFTSVVKAPVPWRIQNTLGRTITKSRSGPLLPGYIIPGNKLGAHRQSVPGLSLPGQTQQFDGRVPFNPFSNLISTSFVNDNSDSIGYGIGIHGLNLLNLDIQRLYPFYANSVPLRTNGQYLPLTFGLGLGTEFDFNKKWKGFGGKLDIPILGLNEMCDFSGNIIQKLAGRALTKGALDFPILATPYRFPLSGKIGFVPQDFQVHYGQALPNLNFHGIRKEHVFNQFSHGRLANPAFIGFR